MHISKKFIAAKHLKDETSVFMDVSGTIEYE